jgi:hypothetical protein
MNRRSRVYLCIRMPRLKPVRRYWPTSREDPVTLRMWFAAIHRILEAGSYSHAPRWMAS